MIPGLGDQALHQALCWTWSLLEILSLSPSLCSSPLLALSLLKKEKEKKRKEKERKGKKKKERKKKKEKKRKKEKGGKKERKEGDSWHYRDPGVNTCEAIYHVIIFTFLNLSALIYQVQIIKL